DCRNREEAQMSASGERPWPDCPLVVVYGLGVDSTAMLIEFARRGIRPDLILFADTGGEKPQTYQYLHVIRPFLARVGFPDVTVARAAQAGRLSHPRGAMPARANLLRRVGPEHAKEVS